MADQGTDIEIARAATQLPITEIGSKLNIPSAALHPYGSNKAKVDYGFLEEISNRPRGKLILVTASRRRRRARARRPPRWVWAMA